MGFTGPSAQLDRTGARAAGGGSRRPVVLAAALVRLSHVSVPARLLARILAEARRANAGGYRRAPVNACPGAIRGGVRSGFCRCPLRHAAALAPASGSDPRRQGE